jgi:hypothetical protein
VEAATKEEKKEGIGMKRVLVFEAKADQVRVRQRKGGRLEVSVDEKVFVGWVAEADQPMANALAAIARGSAQCTVEGVHDRHQLSEVSLCPGMTQDLLDALTDAVVGGEEQKANEEFFRSLQDEQLVFHKFEHHAECTGVKCCKLIDGTTCGKAFEDKVHQPVNYDITRPKGNGGPKRLRDKEKKADG